MVAPIAEYRSISISQSDERGVKGHAGQIISAIVLLKPRCSCVLQSIRQDPQLTVNDRHRHNLAIDPQEFEFFMRVTW